MRKVSWMEWCRHQAPGKPTKNSSWVNLTPEDLYKFARQSNEINVFYMNKNRVKENSERYRPHARWRHHGVEDKY